MDEALHPARDEYITVSDYRRQFFGFADEKGRIPLNHRARCPACKWRMSVVAGLREGSVGHFAHLAEVEGRKRPYCPTDNDRAYCGLTPTTPDEAHAARLKALFASGWRRHIAAFKALVPRFCPPDLDIALAQANRKNIWAYRDLQEWEVVYILVLATDFPSRDGDFGRNLWFRFYFAHSMRNVGELWIAPPRDLRLLRAAHRPPEAGQRRPIGQPIKVREMDRTRDHLEAPVAALSPGAVAWYEKVVRKHLP